MTVLKTTLAGGTATDPRLPIGIDRDPDMTGGTLFRWRPRSQACLPGQAASNVTGAHKDMTDQTGLTLYSLGGSSTPFFSAATGEYQILDAASGGNQGLYRPTTRNLAAAGAEAHELLFGMAMRPYLAPADSSERSAFRIGKQTLAAGEYLTGNNWFQFLQNNASRGGFYAMFAGQFFTVGPATQNVAVHFWLHVKPNPAVGLTEVTIYSARYTDPQVAPKAVTITIPYVPLIDSGSHRIALSTDGSVGSIRYNGGYFELHAEDVTVSGVSVPDLIARQWARNKAIYV